MFPKRTMEKCRIQSKSDSDDGHEEKKNKVPGKAARKRKNKRSRTEKAEMEKDKVEQKRLESLLFGTIYDQQVSTELGNEFELLQGERKYAGKGRSRVVHRQNPRIPKRCIRRRRFQVAE